MRKIYLDFSVTDKINKMVPAAGVWIRVEKSVDSSVDFGVDSTQDSTLESTLFSTLIHTPTAGNYFVGVPKFRFFDVFMYLNKKSEILTFLVGHNIIWKIVNHLSVANFVRRHSIREKRVVLLNYYSVVHMFMDRLIALA